MSLAAYKSPLLAQHQSILFGRFPGEVREIIYFHAFSEHYEEDNVYESSSYFKRLGLPGRGRTEISLLRTCQRVYQEAWALPWRFRLHTLFLAEGWVQPERTMTKTGMAAELKARYESHGDDGAKIEQAKVFADARVLESGTKLQELLDIPHFNPDSITIIVRNIDWKGWETERPLCLDSRFARQCRFPDSVCEVRMELESTVRRRSNLEIIADSIRFNWCFRRRDGSQFVAVEEAPDIVTQWEGSSVWIEKRWLRDESKPGRVMYFVRTVRFLVQPIDLPPLEPSDPRSDPPYVEEQLPQLHHEGRTSVHVDDLEDRGIDESHTAEEVNKFMDRWTEWCDCMIKGGGRSDCCSTGKRLGSSYVENGSGSKFCDNCRTQGVCHNVKSERDASQPSA